MQPIFLQLIPYLPTADLSFYISSATYDPFVSHTATKESQQCKSSAGKTNMPLEYFLKYF